MMGVRSKLAHVGEKKKNYPWLGINPDHGFIVLFTSANWGVVVWSNNARYPHRPVGLAEGWEEDCFIPFNGAITLESAE